MPAEMATTQASCRRHGVDHTSRRCRRDAGGKSSATGQEISAELEMSSHTAALGEANFAASRIIFARPATLAKYRRHRDTVYR